MKEDIGTKQTFIESNQHSSSHDRKIIPESPRKTIYIPKEVPSEFHILNDVTISNNQMMQHTRQFIVNLIKDINNVQNETKTL